MHQRVVFEIDLLVFILREVCIKLVKLVGEQKPVVGQSQVFGFCASLVHFIGSVRIDDYEPENDVLAILLRTVDIFSLKDVRKAQKEADLAIEIDAKGASLLEIDNADKRVETGYQTIMNHEDEILKLIK